MITDSYERLCIEMLILVLIHECCLCQFSSNMTLHVLVSLFAIAWSQVIIPLCVCLSLLVDEQKDVVAVLPSAPDTQ